ncbi:hypothetical protein TREES_T100007806 [Tupaia chinensis]|uniref:Uncharacterized protein n=1 Tax=Tupaia chinensis TaxID=246437 RepID=L9KI36_TUPCH|nr:hypothetical protein TREES_T100007806 [Tupaia chinensis]
MLSCSALTLQTSISYCVQGSRGIVLKKPGRSSAYVAFSLGEQPPDPPTVPSMETDKPTDHRTCFRTQPRENQENKLLWLDGSVLK